MAPKIARILSTGENAILKYFWVKNLPDLTSTVINLKKITHSTPTRLRSVVPQIYEG